MTTSIFYFRSDGPLPPGQTPPVPVEEPPDGPQAEPVAPVDEPEPDEPMRQ